jgi:hypothetical protein
LLHLLEEFQRRGTIVRPVRSAKTSGRVLIASEKQLRIPERHDDALGSIGAEESLRVTP